MLGRNKRLEPDEATRVIRDIVRLTGNVVLSKHCRTRMKERNLTIHDLLAVLSNGVVKEPPEYSEEHEQYKLRSWTIQLIAERQQPLP